MPGRVKNPRLRISQPFRLSLERLGRFEIRLVVTTTAGLDIAQENDAGECAAEISANAKSPHAVTRKLSIIEHETVAGIQ